MAGYLIAISSSPHEATIVITIAALPSFSVLEYFTVVASLKMTCHSIHELSFCTTIIFLTVYQWLDSLNVPRQTDNLFFLFTLHF